MSENSRIERESLKRQYLADTLPYQWKIFQLIKNRLTVIMLKIQKYNTGEKGFEPLKLKKLERFQDVYIKPDSVNLLFA
jgi:hypothetical protein